MAPETLDLIKESDEVYYCRGPIVRIGAKEIAFLKAAAGEIPRRRARICTHPDIENQIHEMLIIHARDSYVPPHKHPGKSESFHIVEGLLTVILFDDAGAPTTRIPLGDAASGRQFYYRISESLFHTVIAEGDWVVFHEVTNGPFRHGETVFPTWAPADGDDEATQQAYVKTLMADVTNI